MSSPYLKPHTPSWKTTEEHEFRDKVPAYIQEALDRNLLPLKAISEISYFGTGENSVVAKISEGRRSFILRFAFMDGLVDHEVFFMKAWEKTGVRVPQIISHHCTDSQVSVSFIVYEYVQEPLLSDALTAEEMIRSGISREIGRTSALMHTLKGKNFGYPSQANPRRGVFASLREELEEWLSLNERCVLYEKKVLNDNSRKRVADAIGVLEMDMVRIAIPSLTHNDFRPYNMFYTRPKITIFDPFPRITHPMMCLGGTILKAMLEGGGDAEVSEILKGYREIGEVDENVLDAAIVLRVMSSLPSWYAKGRMKKIEKAVKVARL